MHEAALRIHADVVFMPKCHSPFFFVELMSGSRFFSSFFVLDGASMIVASTIVPFFMSR